MSVSKVESGSAGIAFRTSPTHDESIVPSDRPRGTGDDDRDADTDHLRKEDPEYDRRDMRDDNVLFSSWTRYIAGKHTYIPHRRQEPKWLNLNSGMNRYQSTC